MNLIIQQLVRNSEQQQVCDVSCNLAKNSVRYPINRRKVINKILAYASSASASVDATAVMSLNNIGSLIQINQEKEEASLKSDCVNVR